MSSNCVWTVRVLVCQEMGVQVTAVTSSEAMEKAEKMPGIIKALEAVTDEEFRLDGSANWQA